MDDFIYLLGKSDPQNLYPKEIRRLGYRAGLLLDSNSKLTARPDFDHIETFDFNNIDYEIERISKKNLKISGLITIYEKYVTPAAIISNTLGIPGMPIDSALACADKELMRNMFRRYSATISPNFAKVDSLDDALRFADSHEFPLILKPANLSKSLLITKNNNKIDLIANYKLITELVKETYAKYAPDQTPKILIEEFMAGSVHSVDAFVDNHGEPHVMSGIVDYQTGYDIGYDDNFHYSRLLPSGLTPKERGEIRNIAADGCRALNMKNSPAHIEIIMTKSGPMIVEIGARNGGYRHRMYLAANGINIIENAINIATGKSVNIAPTKDEPCAVLELFPIKPGHFKGIEKYQEAQALQSLEYISTKAKLGQYIGKSSEGYKMAAVIMLHNSNVAQFENDMDFVNNNVKVVTF